MSLNIRVITSDRKAEDQTKNSPSVKTISDGEYNCMQNKCNTWIKYKNVLRNHKNDNMSSLQLNSGQRFIYIVFTWEEYKL